MKLQSRKTSFPSGSLCIVILLLFVGDFVGIHASSSATSTSSTTSTAGTSSSSTSSTSIPRSIDRHNNYGERATRFPPWNPSPQIDENGFLMSKYQRVPGEWEKDVKLRKKDQLLHSSQPALATIRQVPGDGNCLFHSISTCYSYAKNGTHLNLQSPETMEWLYQHSTKLRQLAVDCLEERRKLLFLQGHEYLKARDLVEAAASQYGISGKEYCELMRQDSYWGGGPEIVALCNVLQRPIHVYELQVSQKEANPTSPNSRTKNQQVNSRARGGGSSTASISSSSSSFVLRRMACFGSPKFDKYPALHILSADSRFPDITPGNQLPSGNHFLAIFPEPRVKISHQRDEEKKKKQRIRGGDNGRRMSDRRKDEEEYQVENKNWWNRFWG